MRDAANQQLIGSHDDSGVDSLAVDSDNEPVEVVEATEQSDEQPTSSAQLGEAVEPATTGMDCSDPDLGCVEKRTSTCK